MFHKLGQFVSSVLAFSDDTFLPPNIIGIIANIMIGQINGAMKVRALSEPGDILDMKGIENKTIIGKAQQRIM